jgi:hypothetical protein
VFSTKIPSRATLTGGKGKHLPDSMQYRFPDADPEGRTAALFFDLMDPSSGAFFDRRGVFHKIVTFGGKHEHFERDSGIVRTDRVLPISVGSLLIKISGLGGRRRIYAFANLEPAGVFSFLENIPSSSSFSIDWDLVTGRFTATDARRDGCC